MVSFTTFNQTKIISHKSHSGSNSTFHKALKNKLFDIGDSNFGVAPEILVRNAKLDSVIKISKEKVIMVTSETCQDLYRDQTEHLWRAGRDTVSNHPVFNTEITVDSMKEILAKQYYFNNEINNTVFIGFDAPIITKDTVIKRLIENKEIKSKKPEKQTKSKRIGGGKLILLIFFASILCRCIL